MTKKKKAEDIPKVNEPEAIYSKKPTLRFFSSFEEMNEADAKEMAALSPLESLIQTTALIERLYADKLKSGIKGRKIYFNREEQ